MRRIALIAVPALFAAMPHAAPALPSFVEPAGLVPTAQIVFDDFSTGTNLATLNAAATGFTFASSSLSFVASGGGWGFDSDPGARALVTATMDVGFDAPQTTVGFVFGGNSPNRVDVVVHSPGGGLAGTLTVTSESGGPFGEANWIAYTISDPDGIGFLSFRPEVNGSFDYGFLSFTAYAEASDVPAPAGAALLISAAAALGGFGLKGRRRRGAA